MTSQTAVSPTPPAASASRRPFLARLAIIAVSALVLTAFIAYAVVSYIGYTVIANPPRVYADAAPAGQYENIRFKARGRDYDVVAFLLTPSEAEGAADNGLAIINVHGRFGSRLSEQQIERATAFRALGYTVLSPDLSDNGGQTVEDDRSAMGYDEQFDVLGAFDELVARGFAPERIGLLGESMGGATVLSAAEREPRIRAVWADSAYGDAAGVLREQSSSAGFPPIVVEGGLVWASLLAGDYIAEVSPIAAGPALAAAGQQVYLTHCQGDQIVFYHHSVDLAAAYEAAGVEVTFWDQPCERHAESFYSNQAEYLGRMDAFFRAGLG